jgi:hypothetical protein
MSTQPTALPPYDTTNDLISPAPVKFRHGKDKLATPDGVKDVFILTFYGVQSSFTLVIDLEQSDQFAQAITDAVRHAKSGIVLPAADMSLFKGNGKKL